MAVNKVIYEGQTLIDITDSTVTAGDLRTGVTAYNRAGEKIIGNADWTVTVQKGSVSKISGTEDDYLLTMTT